MAAGIDPDPNRLGGLEWVRRTHGRLTRRERARLLAAIARGQWENVVGRTKLMFGSVPPGAADVDLDAFAVPETRFAREAEEACAELPQGWIRHSYRTWLFGNALAVVDGTQLDLELFYCGALLHDYGIINPTPGEDFTARSAERTSAAAAAADADPQRAHQLVDAICVHATPGVTIERDGPLGTYLQWGAMVDGAGLRSWDITSDVRSEVSRRHPREGFKAELIAVVRAEASAVPGGRFDLLRRCGMTLAVRMAPFPS
jgi:hypothetical protein